MKFQKIKMEDAGWQSYTGEFGGVQFVNGVSTEPVPEFMMERLGAIMKMTACDDDVQVSASISRERSLRGNPGNAPAAKAEKTATFVASEAPAEEVEVEVDLEDEAEAPSSKGHTLDELEAIADERGIAGLREVAEPMGIRGRSISELIREILEAQNK